MLEEEKKLAIKSVKVTAKTVKGNTGQHWVALNDIKGNITNMVDSGSSNTNLWLAYNSVNTSQIRYFKAKK